MFQLCMVLGAYHRLLQILLGEEHVLPLGILQLIGVMEDLAPIYLNDWIKGPQQCAELMSAIDIYTWSWADQQQHTDDPVLPDFGLLAQKLRLRDWTPPPLSAKISAVVRGLPATGTAATKSTPGPMAEAAVNTNREPSVFDGHLSVAKLLKVATPPRLPNGNVPCLFYHIHGLCSRSPCPYKADHCKHTAAETAVLAAYKAEHMAAARAAPDRA
jgi:hypothetical protein